MFRNYLFTISFISILTALCQAQYVSHVSIPDTSTPKVTIKSDMAYRYASGISPSTLRDHLRVIASDSLEGRETGSKGIDKASEYLQKHLRNLGLLPVPSSGNYFQNVAFTFEKWTETNIVVNNTKYRMEWDYIMFPDENAHIPEIKASEVIFLGYGIDDPVYSDYKKIDVRNKVILINKGEPKNKNEKNIITGNLNPSKWSDDLKLKLEVAKNKGAKLILVIEDDIKKVLQDNRRKILSGSMSLGNTIDKTLNTCNYIFISSTIAKSIIGDQEKKVLKARDKMMSGTPENVKLKTDIIINMAKSANVLEGKNVIGYIEGKTKPNEYVIVTAHYDHLGKRGDEVYNGANDNGSGTVTLMELARACQQAVMEGNPPNRSIVFMWVCGEEKGLLGSQYYSENPVFPLSETVVNLNVDMVGRIDEKYKNNPDYIYVIGSDRLSTDLHKINEAANQKYTQLTLDYTYNDENDKNRYYFRSDHYNFARKGVPAIFFFNGTHEDYHRTTDDIEKIQFDKMANVGQLIFHTLWEVANRKERIVVDGEIK